MFLIISMFNIIKFTYTIIKMKIHLIKLVLYIDITIFEIVIIKTYGSRYPD